MDHVSAGAADAGSVRTATRRPGRPRHRGRVAGVLVLGGLVVAMAVAIGLARDYPAWRAGATVREGARLVGEGDYALAARRLVRAVAARPDDARAHYYLGVAYARLGARTGALSQLGDAVRLAPADPLMHDGLGQALRRLGDSRVAVAELETAARLGPDEARYRVHLAGALLETGDTAGALARLHEAARLRPRSAAIRLLLAAALARAGDREAMADEYREARRLDVGGPLGEIATLQLNERTLP